MAVACFGQDDNIHAFIATFQFVNFPLNDSFDILELVGVGGLDYAGSKIANLIGGRRGSGKRNGTCAESDIQSDGFFHCFFPFDDRYYINFEDLFVLCFVSL